MKKICFFNSYPAWGGGVKFYLDHAIGMRDMGYDIIAVCTPGSVLSSEYAAASIPQWNINVTGRSLLNPVKTARLLRFYKKEKIDAVIFTTSEDLKLGSITAKLAGVKTIVYRRGLAVPIKNRWTNRYIFKDVLTHIMANSEETKRTILKNMASHINPDKIQVIYNGIETSGRENVRPLALAPSNNRVVIGNAGRLVEQKGQAHLIPLALALKEKGLEFIIYIAGAGPLGDELRQQIDAQHLSEDIILLGYVEDMNGFMAALDVFVLTSEWEGFGYVLVEAMLAQKPVVAFHTSSNPEIVLEGETGYLVEYADIDKLADRVAQLIMNPSLRGKMGLAGDKRANERFELNKQIRRFEKYLFT